MLPRDVQTTVILLATTLATGKAFLLPLLFPLSIKITIHSNRKHPPPPKPDYHFSTVPLYKEVVVKGSIGNSGFKHSYGDGHKYGTSYGDGHVKVYTDEPHIKGHKYAKGYGAGSGAHYPSQVYPDTAVHHKGTEYIDDPYSHNKGNVHFPAPDTAVHHKGTEYIDDQYPHNKGNVHFPDPHYKGTPQQHYKGSEYANGSPDPHYKGSPQQHYKGTEYAEGVPPDPHYKGTPQQHYKGTPHQHYPGTEYIEVPETHYLPETQPGQHYKGTDVIFPDAHSKGGKKKSYNKNHSYIKSVGKYKMADYVPNNGGQHHDYDEKTNGHVSHVAIPPQVQPGHTYADISEAHKAVHAPKAYEAQEYVDLGAHQYRPVQKQYADDGSYLDDSLPAYKYPPTQYFARTGEAAPDPAGTTAYAGYGTSIYGDSYAKVVYEPKNLKISIRAYKH